MTDASIARIMDALRVVVNSCLELVRLCLWPRVRPKVAQRVCVFRNGQVGDTICALPAIAAIRKAYPNAHLTLLTTPVLRNLPSAKDILDEAEWIDEIKVYYKDQIDTFAKRLRFIRALRKEPFDVWIELPIELATPGLLLRNMLAARLAGSRWGCGWHVSFLPLGVQAQVELHRAFPNEVERLRELLRTCGLDANSDIAFPLPIGAKQEEKVAGLMAEYALNSARLVAIAPCAKREPNRWPRERFAQVGKHLVSLGFKVIVVAGASDRDLCEDVAGRIGNDAINLAGTTSINESSELLRRCELLICNDSGVQHMAAAVGTPCLSLFSARDMPGKWSPYGAHNVVLRKQVECHTCFAEKCPRDNLCMKVITAEEVIAALDTMIEQSKGEAA
jgi:ADP-heptose:LPS heptosyltransferase